jgi:hypothetical protein
MGEPAVMTGLTSAAISQPDRARTLRSWRTATGLTAVAAGATIVAGAFLPWVEAFAGLIQIPGVRGGNGRILAAAGVLIAAAGIYHLVRGRGSGACWLIGAGGFGSLTFSGYLLMRLHGSLNSLGGDSMVIARGGPGLWVVAAGALLAFVTLFLPPSSQTTFRRRDRAGGFLAWAADRESAGGRRALQIALGGAWLLDAALQYQPFMFSKSFVSQVISPSAMGSPALLANPVMLSSQLIGHDTAAFNAAFATIQLLLAVGLLWRRSVKAALAGTIVWSLTVWWLGEGLGGIFTGTGTPISGAPGAAILYALIAILAWPARSGLPGRSGSARTASAAAGSPLGDRWAQLAWLAVWGSSAVLLLQAASRAPLGLHDTIAAQAAGEPRWIAAIDHGVAAGIGHHGTLVAVLLAIVFAAVAAGVVSAQTIRPALAMSVVVALVIWVVGENFGGIFTGRGTDPNTGPLLILLAAAFWPAARRRRRPQDGPAAVPEAVPVPAAVPGSPAVPAPLVTASMVHSGVRQSHFPMPAGRRKRA